MENPKGYQKALNFAYFYLKFRSRTVSEMQRYLERKAEKYELSSEVIQKVIENLIEEKLLNDNDFVRMFVEQRSAFKPRGEKLLRQELSRLGINKDTLDNYFNQFPINQDKQAKQLLETKWYRFKELDQKKRFEKAASFLLRKGFSYDVARKTIAEIEEKR